MKRFIFIISMMCIAALGFSGLSVEAKAASKYELTQLIQEEVETKNKLHGIAEVARGLGLPENHCIITSAKKEWHESDDRHKQYKQKLSNWAKKEKEYPSATFVWNYLKEQGLNDYVCAGIMGNLMAETGGQTLAIQPILWSNGYYGICMWSLYYCPNVSGMTLEQQCKYLCDSMIKEINTYGFCYYSGFNYNSFINMKNARDAAVAFASTYERCGSGSYYVRQNNADKAYKYFTSDS